MVDTVQQLQTIMTLDHTRFMISLKQAETGVSTFSSKAVASIEEISVGFAALAAGAATLLLHNLIKNAEAIDVIYNKSQALGIAVNKFQALSLAADETGVSSESLGNLLGKMEKTLGNAASGGKQAADALGQLGLSTKELIGLTPDQQFIKIATAIKGLNDQNLQASDAVKIFGRNATQALGLFKSDIGTAVDKAKELGLTLTGEQAKGLHEFSVKVKELDATWHAFWAQTASAAAPFLQEGLTEAQKLIKEWGGMEVIARRVADVFETEIRGMIYAMQALNKTIDLGVKSFINLQGYMASNELTDLQNPNSQASQNLSPDARKARISELEKLINEKYTAANTSLDVSGFAKKQANIGDSVVSGTSNLDLSKFANSVTTTSSSLVALGSMADIAKTSLKALNDQAERRSKLENLLYGEFADNSKPKLKSSEDFKEVARTIIEDSLNGTLSKDSVNARISDLEMWKNLDANKFDDKGQLIDFDTHKQDKQIEELKKLINGDSNAKTNVEVTVNASPLLDAKITKISKNSFTDAVNAEAMAVNR